MLMMNVQSDLGLHCLPTEPTNENCTIYGQRRLVSDSASLGFDCSHMVNIYSHCTSYVNAYTGKLMLNKHLRERQKAVT